MSTEIELAVERFSHSDNPAHTGNRGTRVGGDTGAWPQSRVFSPKFPTYYVTDGGTVEPDEGGVYTAEDFATYLRLVADHIDARVAENKAAGR